MNTHVDLSASSMGVARARPAAAAGRLVEARLAFDGLAIAGALATAFVLRFHLGVLAVTETSPLTVRAHALACVLWVVGTIGAMAINRLYDHDTLFVGGGEQSRVVRSVIEASALVSTFVFLTQSFYVSRSWFGLTVVLTTAFVGLERQLVRRYVSRAYAAGRRRRPAVLVSTGDDDWKDWPFEDVHEFEVVARMAPEEFEAFTGAAEFENAAVVLRARDFSHDEFWRTLLIAGERGWSVFVHSPVRSVGRDRLTVRELGGQTIVKVAPPFLTGRRAVAKRILDVALSGFLLILLVPIIAAAALGILVIPGRPVLYKQQRVGARGRNFDMLKFRTMRVGAEDASGPVWTTENDPRRTKIGRWLRRSSLDELPQLWNVFKGEMSLVGPRPERPTFVEGFERQLNWYRFRHRIRPGMTGWAQSHGLRGNTSLDSRTQFDNWYIENWSVWLDLKILLMTVREIVRGENAY